VNKALSRLEQDQNEANTKKLKVGLVKEILTDYPEVKNLKL